MGKIKFTKGELKRQRDALKQYERYLPTLQLKKQQLQLEILHHLGLLEKKELESLREAVANFENEKEKVVAAAESILEKALTEKFENERRMREQEFKSEKEILNLKLESLTVENQKQTTEIATLQKALNAATAQVKDIAVKVIEAGGAADGRPQGSQLH